MFSKFCLLSLAYVLGMGMAHAGALALSFADPQWTGEQVPKVGICRNHGGKGMSPAINVSAIPKGTVKLVLKFGDRDWRSEGAHGVVGIAMADGSATASIPSFQGETDELPGGVEKIASHQCYSCGGGVYLGPCSGGRDHTYYVNVYAKDGTGKTLAKGELILGDY